MCGIAAVVGARRDAAEVPRMVAAVAHRGPDATGVWADDAHEVALGHARLSILDLSSAGRQPMRGGHDGRLHVTFNGEIYNYQELRAALAPYRFRTRTDTEVLLAAYDRWGDACLERLVGMFAFVLWDARQGRLLAARDRFGVKPLFYHVDARGTLRVASEIKALHTAGVPAEPDESAWADFLVQHASDGGARSFWAGVHRVPAGHVLTWQGGRLAVRRWYDVAERSGAAFDGRGEAVVADEYLALMEESVRLRFRSDVPVGLALSGGLDSSTLLGLVSRVRGAGGLTVFTFATGDVAYDELPWVARAVAGAQHRLEVCRLDAADVPALAAAVQAAEDEPFGGIPTLAYARVFERARACGVPVMLDGQGLDEQWAGYDYYARAAAAGAPGEDAPLLQGTTSTPVRPDCLVPEFRALATRRRAPGPFADRLRNLQHRDLCEDKLPRALRYADRVSMRCGVELREPFLDHRLVELALRQPADRKIRDGTGKWLLRRLAAPLLPAAVALAPKRAVQTPQREWLRGPLRDWADACIEEALARRGGAWLEPHAVRRAWRAFQAGHGDHSAFVWQWIGIALLLGDRDAAAATVTTTVTTAPAVTGALA